MLFEKDTLFGHVIIDTADGPVYEDDGSKVAGNIRPCFGCKLAIQQGEHDPCISGLPGTKNACCGHGRETTVTSGGPSGYVALEDGRCFRFAGIKSGDEIRAAVDAALAGGNLPDGFVFDQENMWWTGLTQSQVDYVHAHTREGIFRVVRKITEGQFPPDEYLSDEALFWADGIDDQGVKNQVLSELGAMLDELVAEAKQKA